MIGRIREELFRLRDEQFQNARSPMRCNCVGTLMEVMLEQPLKAPPPISLTVFGSVTVFILLHPANAPSSIMVTGYSAPKKLAVFGTVTEPDVLASMAGEVLSLLS